MLPHLAVMSKKILNVDWKGIAGAAVKKRILKLTKNEEELLSRTLVQLIRVSILVSKAIVEHGNT